MKLNKSNNRKKEFRLKKFIFIIALFASIGTNLLYAQLNDNWKWLNPSPQGNTLRAVDFVDNNTGYAAGDYGTVLKTTNAGNTWNKLAGPNEKNLTSLDFVNGTTGFVGSHSQMLKKTTDAGQTWQSIQLPVSGNWDTAYTIMDINFVNQTTGYVVGFFLLESKIWKTTDAGNSWSTLPVTGADYLKRTYFIDANTGFAYGGPTYSEVIKTTDGGQSWQQVSQESYIAYSMSFINSQVGVYGCESGRIYRTTDGGNSWTFAFCPSSLDIMSIQFVNATTGFGFGTGSVYVKTTDGGVNWEEYSLGTGSIRQYYDASMTPAGIIQAVGSYGAMVRTTNSGATFEVPPFITEHTITDIEFINGNTGYAVAGFGEGDILKTTDAGETWVSQVSSYTLPQYG
ncbi:MAG TPA: YCF48-related protein, partial [Ignavibacteria bacterium]|nr:YCF48-related protein [Ignavibacteria bacterium]